MSNTFDLQHIIPGRALNFVGGEALPSYGPGEMPSPCLHSPASLCILFYTHSFYPLL